MKKMTTIVFATTNRGKLREATSILDGLAVTLTNLNDYSALAEPVEDADTFEGNARIKASYYAKMTGCFTLADDSGLEVDALNGAPGIHSARYAGDECDDAANNAKLIQSLSGVPEEKRTARFRCVIALAGVDGVIASASGTFEGWIVDKPQGDNGFGYDPHFFVPQYQVTSAEMPPDLKNRISHRGQALRKIRTEIEQLLS